MGSANSMALVAPCMHSVLLYPPPRVQDVVWCHKCRDYRRCLSVSKPWSIHCKTKDCNYSAHYGTDEGRVRRTAIRHLRLYPGHDVWLRKGTDQVEKIEYGTQDPLPFVT